MTQYTDLSPERWSQFDLDQQVLLIANEMNRATRLIRRDVRASLQRVYERVLRLVDLTVITNARRGLRRELLRWRDLVAELYVSPDTDALAHARAFRCLLQLTPGASRQIPHVMPGPPPSF